MQHGEQGGERVGRDKVGEAADTAGLGGAGFYSAGKK